MLLFDPRARALCARLAGGDERMIRQCPCQTRPDEPVLEFAVGELGPQKVEVHGCLGELDADADAWVRRVTPYVGFAEQGILPAAGGLEDQVAVFVEALQILLALHGFYSEKAMKG